MLFAGDSDDGQLGPLFKLATCRGKLMERLQVELLDEKSQAEHRDIIERAFLIGMLSLAPVVLGVPPEEAFQELELSDEICSALQDHGGEAGALLNLAESIEDSDLDRILTTLDELDLKRIQLQRAQSESFAWVNGF